MISKKSFLLTLPAYNEDKIINKNLLKIDFYLKKNFFNLINSNKIRLCVALNGTDDNTELCVKKLQRNISYLTYTVTKEKGRGIALDNTWKNAKEDVFLYIDSDLAYDLRDLGKMIREHQKNESPDLAVASRRLKESIVKRSIVRKILTEGYNRLINFLFNNSFTDAQAGCKSIKRTVYLRIRKNINMYKGWFFDTAMLLYAEKNYYKIKDLPITCIDNRKWRLKIFKTVFYFCKRIFLLRIKTFLYKWK
ncbi:MAG: glycosyltransferase [Patescibacteria group bacterium]